ncbi:hypothetical protein SmJEL517_g01532 [Synchytrium microbalum]|uniref:FCP1 homology domain-containing protein n=1 Tax=Synchytrium microbalum TaxID=1806994 RepID=A0A507CFP8_9FUNG|nr:uncharacterized protein SmJEL517_g01532 [Synchytrium microbalum]TPX36333.1 hypothetical protein SmJEL517_g01532 [Synchytrium microbalum]
MIVSTPTKGNNAPSAFITSAPRTKTKIIQRSLHANPSNTPSKSATTPTNGNSPLTVVEGPSTRTTPTRQNPGSSQQQQQLATNSPTRRRIVRSIFPPPAAASIASSSTAAAVEDQGHAKPKRHIGNKRSSDASSITSTKGDSGAAEPVLKAKRISTRKSAKSYESLETPEQQVVDKPLMELDREREESDATVPEVNGSSSTLSGFFSPTYNLLRKWAGVADGKDSDGEAKEDENVPPAESAPSSSPSTKRSTPDPQESCKLIPDDTASTPPPASLSTAAANLNLQSPHHHSYYQNHEHEVEEVENDPDAGGEMAVDDTEDLEDEFDPYSFIRSLPPLTKEQLARPCVLPRRTRSTPKITLVLDLDETLVHCSTASIEASDINFPVEFNDQSYHVSGRLRPFCREFLEGAARMFEVVVFTASQKIYAEKVLNILDPEKKLIKYRLFRDSCLLVYGNYLKDLTILNRDMMKMVIVDNSPQAFGFQVDNGIPITSWYEDSTDCELKTLLEFLKTIQHVEDVRPRVAETFGLRERVEAARPMLLM